MKTKYYILKDVKLNRFNLPFPARDDDEARYNILRAKFPKHIYSDLDLYYLGEFDDVEGTFTSCFNRVGLLPFVEFN